MSETTEKRSWLARLGRWLAELVLVFVGVYAAFWLSNYQQQQQNLQRRDRILAYLEQRLEDGISSATIDGAKEEKLVAAFKRSLDAGEMPPLHPFAFSTDYNPADIATLLQSEKYSEALELVVKLFHDMEKTQTDLLQQIQAERKRH